MNKSVLSTKDREAIASGVSHILNRKQRAYDRFSAIVANRLGCDAALAGKVVDLLIKVRAAKYSVGCDSLNVTHGAFLEKDVLARAAAQVAA